MSEELRSEAEVLAAFEAARAELAASHVELQEAIDDLNSRPLLTDEEREKLEEQAESGALGEDMRTLVGKIRDGEDTWEAVFAGESPNGALLQGHLTTQLEEHLEDIQLAWEDLLDEEEAQGNYLGPDGPRHAAP
ncbi:MAG: hypothetical protein AVDCRST_MAG32-653 [uncultured Nocardioides sp.]|uniref:Uncharacterized protein n=1 Tax=uncultured Nocardioides sp. TaxID=198441 RepID=A0A6J4MYN0_9ACTN|nr:MAG: hypothetical protein AVDCRST_MAG32-653 [uncultured Nocardioides sp.]